MIQGCYVIIQDCHAINNFLQWYIFPLFYSDNAKGNKESDTTILGELFGASNNAAAAQNPDVCIQVHVFFFYLHAFDWYVIDDFSFERNK